MKNINKKQIMMIGVLAILVLYWVIDSGIFSSTDDLMDQGGIPGDQIESEEVVADNIEKYTHVAALVQIPWTKGWKSDPFFYAEGGSDDESEKSGLLNNLFGKTKTKSESVRLKLTGISWVGNSGFALINGNVVEEGDFISGYEVEHIAFNYVTLKQGLSTIRLTMNE